MIGTNGFKIDTKDINRLKINTKDKAGHKTVRMDTNMNKRHYYTKWTEWTRMECTNGHNRPKWAKQTQNQHKRQTRTKIGQNGHNGDKQTQYAEMDIIGSNGQKQTQRHTRAHNGKNE